MDDQNTGFRRQALGAVRRFLSDLRGATAIEYGLIAALVAMALFIGLRYYYNQLGALFNHVEETTNNATSNLGT